MVVTLAGHGKALIFIDKHQRLILLFLVGRLNHLEEIEDPTLKFVSALDSDLMMKQQFRRLQQRSAATCGLGYCLEGFADIFFYYMINHKIRHSGKTDIYCSFLKKFCITAWFVLFSFLLRLEPLTNSYPVQAVIQKESSADRSETNGVFY